MQLQKSSWKWAIPVAALAVAWLMSPRRESAELPRRAVPVDVEIDLGTFASSALREYRIRRGDTLGAIAQAELGSVRQLKTLQRWNPNIKPTALRIGQPLRLPPAGAASDGLAFFAWQRDAGGGGRLRGVGQGTRLKGLTHGLILLATPLARVPEVESQLRDAEAFGVALPAIKGTYQSDVLAAAPTVLEQDITERVLMQVVVERMTDDRRIHAQAVQVRLDGKGRTIPPVEFETNEWATLALTVLGLLALTIAVIFGARRLELAHE